MLVARLKEENAKLRSQVMELQALPVFAREGGNGIAASNKGITLARSY